MSRCADSVVMSGVSAVAVCLAAVVLAGGCGSTTPTMTDSPRSASGLKAAAIALETAIERGDQKTSFAFIPAACRKGKTGAYIRASLAQASRTGSDSAKFTATTRRISEGHGEANVHIRYSGPGMTGSANTGWSPFQYNRGTWRLAC